MATTQNQKLLVAIAISAIIIGLGFDQAQAQKKPKPTPTPVPGAQIETGAARTTPNQSTTAIGGGKADKSNGLLQVQSGPGGGGMNGNSKAGLITLLRISVFTGDDDLRKGSRLRAFLVVRGGGTLESPPLNCLFPSCKIYPDDEGAEGFANGTTKTFEWAVSVLPSEVYRFGLLFTSGKTNDFETPDNWNLNKVIVEYVVPLGSDQSPAGTFLMYTGSGKPLYRFKDRDEWRTDPLSLPK